MTSFEAIQNTPGYMPMADEPAVFESAAEAWGYLADERERGEDYGPGDGSYSVTTLLLRALAENPSAHVGSYLNPDGTGVIYGGTPDYDGDHDLGIAYSVVISEMEVED